MQNNIRRWRLARGLSQEELGRRVGLSKASISKLERGGVRLRDVTISRLVEALDVPAEALLGDYAAGPDHPADGAGASAQAEGGEARPEATDAAAGPTAGGRETHFGFRKVPVDEKRRLVQGVFSRVAADYDLMNDLMSAGIHRLWKNEMVAWLRPRPGIAVVDVAGGTGDIAFRILDRAGGAAAGVRVTVLDANPEMLAVGRDRAFDRGICAGLDWLCGDAEALPLADCSVDAYTIAFGIRNVPRIEAALAEARRVLRPGGRFLCLEFSHVVVPGLDALYDAYSFNLLPALGAVVAGDRDAYQYLVESIRRFPDQESFAEMIRAAGLGQVRYRNLSGGIAAIHSAWRI